MKKCFQNILRRKEILNHLGRNSFETIQGKADNIMIIIIFTSKHQCSLFIKNLFYYLYKNINLKQSHVNLKIH